MIASIETALVADDDLLMRDFIVETLRRLGMTATAAGDGGEARKRLEEEDYDLVFLDVKMPGLDGLELLRHMRARAIPSLVVIITAFGTVEQAVEAMKLGAADFLMKPFSPEQIELVVRRAQEWVALRAQNAYLQEELGWRLPGGRRLLGQSPPMKELMRTLRQVAPSNATVLITGESGTGKELVAHALHELSTRKDGPFIRMNCAAVPDSLMDSELFGHEKGAFTGAVSRRLGRFELAHGGTLLLDEITEMKQEVQAKLLRVLQEHEFERVGGSRTLHTDCRIIATSNRDLAAEVKAGRFREDLYYRLNVVPIHVPPLRERREDIPLLAHAFLAAFRSGNGYGELRFTPEAMERLVRYSWPGNVRELMNLVHRLAVLQPGPEVGPEALPTDIRGSPSDVPSPSCAAAAPASETGPKGEQLRLDALEQAAILKALTLYQGNRQKTAEALGISIRTLRNKLNRYRKAGVLPPDT